MRLPLKIGDKKNRLTLIECLGPNKWGRINWKAQCDCGNFIEVPGHEFNSGHTKSCGCLKKDILRANRLSHGASTSEEYRIWTGMKSRCYLPMFPGYENWGGRGIGVCERWRDSFENFLADMGPRPSPIHTLERVDNDADYSPENCIWATRLTQMQNRRNTVHIKFNGQVLALSEAARQAGINAPSVHTRIRRYGESPQEAFEHFVANPVREPVYLHETYGKDKNAPP